MATSSQPVSSPGRRLNSNFWTFWVGQTVSNLGSSFTAFALPLLVYNLTHSALNLAGITVATFLPYLLFGLVIGAWVDRVDRKRLMILADLARALLIASIPLLAGLHLLADWWFYVVAFLYSILTISFDTGQFTAIPGLVDRDDLVTANGRIQASYSAAGVIGPLLAGLLLALISIPLLLLFDTASFLISAVSLALVRVSFNAPARKEAGEEAQKEKPKLHQDIVEGLRYVLSHPVLRSLSLMMVLVNLFAYTTNAQLVLFARLQLQASNTQVGFLYAAEGIGAIILSLAVGPVSKRFSFSVLALGSLMLYGALIVLFSLLHWFWAAAPVWGLIWGISIVFNINTSSLRQAIVPNQMLGRVMTIATVLGFSAIPLGSLIGGLVIGQGQHVALVYGVIGACVFCIAVAFSFTAVGHARRYIEEQKAS